MLPIAFSNMNLGPEIPIASLVPNATHSPSLAVREAMLSRRTRRVVTLPAPIPRVTRAALLSGVTRSTLISLMAVVSGMSRAASISGLSGIPGLPRITLLTGLSGRSRRPRRPLSCCRRGRHGTPGNR
jgi:hypothetical protein